jgi:hypothetical protein
VIMAMDCRVLEKEGGGGGAGAGGGGEGAVAGAGRGLGRYFLNLIYCSKNGSTS